MKMGGNEGQQDDAAPHCMQDSSILKLRVAGESCRDALWNEGIQPVIVMVKTEPWQQKGGGPGLLTVMTNTTLKVLPLLGLGHWTLEAVAGAPHKAPSFSSCQMPELQTRWIGE